MKKYKVRFLDSGTVTIEADGYENKHGFINFLSLDKKEQDWGESYGVVKVDDRLVATFYAETITGVWLIED